VAITRQYKLLGRLAIEENGRPSAVMKYSKGCALLAYLIITRQTYGREAVADLLWEATSTAQSLQNLRKLLHQLRPLVPELVVSRQQVSFQANELVAIDLYQLAAALAGQDIARLEAALSLYQGELLDGFYLDDAPRFSEWLVLERERWRQQVWDGYRRVCAACAEQEAWEKGVQTARRWLALDEVDEEIQRQLMHFLAAAGRVDAALAQYESCRQLLWQELGVEPEPATTALAAQMEELTLPAAGELAKPGPLPPRSYLPYHRNMTFTGRSSYLRQLAGLLLPGPESNSGLTKAAVVTGMGGLGKTQLAVEFAYRYGRYYPGGVYWLSFADAGNVAEEVAAIGGDSRMALFDDGDNLTLEQKVKQIRRAWQEPVARLLIFDNCEDEMLAADWLSVSGGCSVLITSRLGRWPKEMPLTTLPLAVLPRTESVALLQQLAGRLTEQEAAAIAEEVGDLPLALQLAAHYLARQDQVSPYDYLAQLWDERVLQHASLRGQFSRYSPTGHELHVARTFALSYERLDPKREVDAVARQLLAGAACFAPGEPIPQALLRATVIADDDWMAALRAEDGLARLVALGFLEAEGHEAVVLHRLPAAFALDVMTADGLTDAVRATVEKTVLRQLAPYLEQPKFQGGLSFPSSHLRHVIEMALARSSASAALLALAFAGYLREMGEFTGAQSYLERALALAVASGDIYTQGRITSVLARVYFSQGFHQESQQRALEAERLLRLADAPAHEWLIAALTRRGWAHLRLGEAELALAAAEESRLLSVGMADPSTAAECLNLLGSIHYFLLGNYETADRYFEEALALSRQIGNRFGEATIIMNLAESANTQGDYGRAETNVQQALAIIREVGNRMREMGFLIILGEVQVHLGDYAAAVATLTEVTTQAPKDWSYTPSAYVDLAEAYLGQGNLDQALVAAQTAGAPAMAGGPYDAGHAWRVLGLIAARLGRPVAPQPTSETTYTASDCFAQSLQIFTDVKNKRARATVLWEWANDELAQGNTAVGQAMWQEAREIFVQLNLPLLVARMDQVGSGP
jgi:DNA-binding SARP family transcriptional activator/Flp pilus assembly protein TadD